MKKVSLLALAVATVLTGCNGSSGGSDSAVEHGKTNEVKYRVAGGSFDASKLDTLTYLAKLSGNKTETITLINKYESKTTSDISRIFDDNIAELSNEIAEVKSNNPTNVGYIEHLEAGREEVENGKAMFSDLVNKGYAKDFFILSTSFLESDTQELDDEVDEGIHFTLSYNNEPERLVELEPDLNIKEPKELFYIHGDDVISGSHWSSETYKSGNTESLEAIDNKLETIFHGQEEVYEADVNSKLRGELGDILSQDPNNKDIQCNWTYKFDSKVIIENIQVDNDLIEALKVNKVSNFELNCEDLGEQEKISWSLSHDRWFNPFFGLVKQTIAADSVVGTNRAHESMDFSLIKYKIK